MEHLLALERCTRIPASGTPTPSLQDIRTQLNLTAWRMTLGGHPDQHFTRCLIKGLTDGFHIGFDQQHNHLPPKRNLPSATEKRELVVHCFEQERALGRFVRHLQPHPLWQINRVEVIPKGHTPGKWRMITDLSHPPAMSVNDSIDLRICTLSYVTVDQVACATAELGRGV